MISRNLVLMASTPTLHLTDSPMDQPGRTGKDWQVKILSFFYAISGEHFCVANSGATRGGGRTEFRPPLAPQKIFSLALRTSFLIEFLTIFSFSTVSHS